jgi:phage/plasmid primase-like uncharacterized protein
MIAPLYEIEAAFAEAIADARLGDTLVPADGKLHRFKTPDDKGRQRTGWAVLHADGVPAGIFGDWRTDTRITWKAQGAKVSGADRRGLDDMRRRREAERLQIQERAAAKAQTLFGRLPSAPPDHPYLVRKAIKPGPARTLNTNALVLPLIDIETDEVVSLQFIQGDGSKRFLAGGRTKGGVLVLGDLRGDQPLVICEGYATGCSIEMATAGPVVVAFNAGNLATVARILRKRHPDREIVMAADNDATGVAKAKEAAKAIGARVVIPPIDGADFNDLYLGQGLEAVQEGFMSEKDALAASAAELIECDDVLGLFAADFAKVVAGEENLAKLLYLVATSRLFHKTMHAAIKGPSSSGKSEIRARVLDFFPPESIVSFTSLSERALIYFDGGFEHKILSMGEAAGSDEQSLQDYLLRELMSEGKLVYHTVERRGTNMNQVAIEKHGPVAFMVTTTRHKLHPENETRMLSLEMDDSEGQTRAVLAKVAEVEGLNTTAAEVDLEPWRDFQRWLEAGERNVIVPYASTLAAKVPPKAVRLRRDVGQVIRAIKAHALIHRAHRDRDVTGAIVADFTDYAVVKELMGDILAEVAEAKTKDSMQETVDAVKSATKGLAETEGATALTVARLLKLDRSAGWRRLRSAEDAGLVVNLETTRGKPSRYRITGEVFDTVEMLPHAEVLEAAFAGEAVQPLQPCNPAPEAQPLQQDARLQERLQAICNPASDAGGCKPRATAHATTENGGISGETGDRLHGCSGCNEGPGEAGPLAVDPDDWSTYADPEDLHHGEDHHQAADHLDLAAEMPAVLKRSTVEESS